MKKHLAVLHTYRGKGLHTVNVNQAHEEFKIKLGFNGKVATVLTGIYGSMWFVYFLALGVAGWMLLQGILGRQAWDPYPYIFCLFIGNLVQLIGGPIIQVGQNLSSAHSEMRAEADYHVNQESFTRLQQIIAHLGRQTSLLEEQQQAIMRQNELILALQQRIAKPQDWS